MKSDEPTLFKSPTEVEVILIEPITPINAFIALDELIIDPALTLFIDAEYLVIAFPIITNFSPKSLGMFRLELNNAPLLYTADITPNKDFIADVELVILSKVAF